MATNKGTSGAFKVGRLNISGTLVFTLAGAPVDGTSGTGVGVANPGSVLLDTTNFAVYKNIGTKASPVWFGEGHAFKNVSLSAAQVLALNATPITLVAAPGASKALIFEGAVIHKPAGTAYGGIAAGEDLAIKYTDASGEDVGVCEMTGFADQTTAQTRFIRPQTGALAAGTVSEINPVANAALVAHMLVGEITTGDSAFRFRMFYRVVPTVLS